jgi:hypothetical protein
MSKHVITPDTNDWKYEDPWSCSCGWTGDRKDVLGHADKHDDAMIHSDFVEKQ